jgi:prepilin-type processing-associated H-X9-DG protein
MHQPIITIGPSRINWTGAGMHWWASGGTRHSLPRELFEPAASRRLEPLHVDGGVEHRRDRLADGRDFVSATEPNIGDTYAAVTARSHHAGGVNALLMDGSVRAVSNSISAVTWRALGTRDGGEVVADF